MNGLVARAVERFGRLDVMMCNAGFAIYGAIDDITPDADAQARGHQLLRHLLRHARGAARLPPPGHAATSSSCRRSSASAASRSWARTRRRSSRRSGLAECLRSEVDGSGIHVSVVYPDLDRHRVQRGHAARNRKRHHPVRWTETDRRTGGRRDRRRDRPSGPRGLPVHEVARPRAAERDRARLLRSAREEIRPPAGNGVARERGLAIMADTSFERARAIADGGSRGRRPRAHRRRLGARSADGPGGSRTSTSRCSACRPTACARCSRGSAASKPSARAFRSTRPATSTSRCRAANRSPDADIAGSRSRAIRT